MQTFLFDELDKQGQRAAVQRYANDPLLLDWQTGHGGQYGLISRAIRALGWRFSEHGERIA